MENFHSVYAKRVPAIERAKERLEGSFAISLQ